MLITNHSANTFPSWLTIKSCTRHSTDQKLSKASNSMYITFFAFFTLCSLTALTTLSLYSLIHLYTLLYVCVCVCMCVCVFGCLVSVNLKVVSRCFFQKIKIIRNTTASSTCKVGVSDSKLNTLSTLTFNQLWYLHF